MTVREQAGTAGPEGRRRRRSRAGSPPTLITAALILASSAGCAHTSTSSEPSNAGAGASAASGTAGPGTQSPAREGQSSPGRTGSPQAVPSSSLSPTPERARRRHYPWHTNIIATTFWVGEVFDPDAGDGSQVVSTYDAHWLAHYGGCDGVVVEGRCTTERRTAANGWFPTRMVPLQNPFYLDLPFDDVNDPMAFRMRESVVPWARDPGYAGRTRDPNASLMKNRWVRLRKGSRICYGQIEDAGPAEYHDATYVFGDGDHRPINRRYNGAGLDVSPALNGCLGFASLNGNDDRVDWQFVDSVDVPPGPWRTLVTSRPVSAG